MFRYYWPALALYWSLGGYLRLFRGAAKKLAKQVASETAKATATVVAGSVAAKTAKKTAHKTAASVAIKTAERVSKKVATDYLEANIPSIAAILEAYDNFRHSQETKSTSDSISHYLGEKNETHESI